jgi:hypothetical protein
MLTKIHLVHHTVQNIYISPPFEIAICKKEFHNVTDENKKETGSTAIRTPVILLDIVELINPEVTYGTSRKSDTCKQEPRV